MLSVFENKALRGEPKDDLPALEKQAESAFTQVTELQRRLLEATQRTGHLSDARDKALKLVASGNADAADLGNLQMSIEATNRVITSLSTELAAAIGVRNKAHTALDEARTRADRERQSRISREMCEIVAPLLDAVVTALERARRLDGFRERFSAWSLCQCQREDRAQGVQYFQSILVALVEMAMDGDEAFIVDAIRRLQEATPDLITPGMKAYLTGVALRMNARAAREAELGKLKAAEAAQEAANKAAMVLAFSGMQYRFLRSPGEGGRQPRASLGGGR